MSRILEYGDSPDAAAFNAINPVQLRFRDLVIGQTFDFVDDSHPGYNSFFRRVMKVSARGYVSIDEPIDAYRVGSINAKVFHVGASAAWEHR